MQRHSNLRGAFGELIKTFGLERREILAELVDGERAVHSPVESADTAQIKVMMSAAT